MIQAADVAMEHVHRIDALTAHFRIEVEAAGGEAARLQDAIHREDQIERIVVELIRVPAVLRIAAVDVDRTEDAERRGGGNFMLEAVAGERCMVGFDVDLHLVLEAVALQEAVHRRGVKIVLMLGGLVRLRLDQDRAVEADAMLVIDDERQEAAELIELAREIGVEQRVVTFAAAPQHVVRAAQTLGRIHRETHLSRGESEHFRIWIGGCTREIARMREQICGAPQQLDAGLGLLALEAVDRSREVLDVLLDRVGSRHHVDVVEGIERRAEAREEIERLIHLVQHRRVIDRAAQPGAIERATTEDVGTVPGERMPVADGRAQVIFHALAEDHAILVVVAIGERIVALQAFVTDGLDVRKIRCRLANGGCARHDYSPRKRRRRS